MKVILTLILIIGVAYSVTIASDSSSNTWAITYTANSSNSSNTDIALTLTHGTATLTNSAQSVVACVDTGVSNYTLSADTPNLGTFIAQVTAGASATDLTGAANSIYGTTTGYTNTGTVWASAASTALTAPATVSAYTTTTATLSFSAVTPTQLAGMKLPNSTQTFYFRCFYAFKVGTAVNYANAVTDLNAGTTGSTNVTLKGSANRYIAIGATIASVIVASLM